MFGHVCVSFFPQYVSSSHFFFFGGLDVIKFFSVPFFSYHEESKLIACVRFFRRSLFFELRVRGMYFVRFFLRFYRGFIV